MFGGDGLLQKGLELLLGQRDGVGQQLLDEPHALAEAVRPVLSAPGKSSMHFYRRGGLGGA